MSSQQSSFREMYDYPQEGQDQRPRKYLIRGSRNRRGNLESARQPRESFFHIVQKAKNVAMFAQTMKERISEKRTLNEHTLKPNEMQFLQSDSQAEQQRTFFAHDNRVLLAAETLFIAVMLLYLWKSTFEMVFGESNDQQVITVCALTAYCLHILLFNITEHKNARQELITDRRAIMDIYLRTKLAKDMLVVAMMALQISAVDSEGAVFVLVRVGSLVSYLELSEACEKVENQLSISNQAESIISICKLLFKICLFLHFLSIALNLLASLENARGITHNWLSNSELDYSSNLEKYVIGWYWGATILSTVGFGEITPVNNIERFFVSIVQVTCCMTFGYFVNVIGSLIKVRAESDEKYEKEVRSVNRFLNFLIIGSDLKHKIRTHYFNKHIIEKVHDLQQERSLLDKLTPSLKTALLQQNNITVLTRSPYMQKFRFETLKHLTQLLKRVIFAPEHILYSRQTTEPRLWFLQSGIVEEFTDVFQGSGLRKKVAVFNEKDSTVGWINFLTETTYRTVAKTPVFTVGYELQGSSFLKIIRDDCRQYRKWLQMRETMMCQGRKFIPKCLSCGRYTHNVIHCPRIHFVRRDIKKLAQQQQQLDRYLADLRSKKTERPNIRCNWKRLLATGQLEHEAKLLTNNESIRVDGGTVENFFRNLGCRESLTGKRPSCVGIRGSNGRGSYVGVTKKESKVEAGFDPREVRDSGDKSLVSFDMDDAEPEQDFQRVFFNLENKDFLPQHDVEEVLGTYAKKYLKRRILAHREVLHRSK